MSSTDIDCLLEDLGRAREQLRIAEIQLIVGALRSDFSICVEKISPRTEVHLVFTDGDNSFSAETVDVDLEKLMWMAKRRSLSERVSIKE